MADRPEAVADNNRIRLAACMPFHLGSLLVEPALRRTSWPGGERILEPRVMQVLVALAQHEGAIIGRDTLIDRCWDGRIVGENAINRVISLLRDLAEESGAFEIETITKVGYRLRPRLSPGRAADQPPQMVASAEVLALPSRRALLMGGGLLLAAGSAAYWLGRPDGPPAEAVELTRHAIDNYRAGGLPDEQVIAQLQEAVRIAPDYAEAWGMLAFVYGQQAEAPTDRPGWRPADRMRAAAEKALALDPDEPRAHGALLWATPVYGNWGRVEPRARQLAGRPDGHPILVGYYGNMLQEVGRFRESAAAFRRVNSSLVINPVGHLQLVTALWASGEDREAEATLDMVERRFPGNPRIWATSVLVRLFGARPAEAIPTLEAAPGNRDPDEVAALLSTARALATPAPAARTRALDAIGRISDRAPSIWATVPALAALDATDRIFPLLNGYYLAAGPFAAMQPKSPFQMSTRFLFFPPMRGTWMDRRFGPLLEAIGLEAYWRSSRTVPDFRRLTGGAGQA